MTEESTRELGDLHRRFAGWLGAHLAATGHDPAEVSVDLRRHTGGGYSNEIVLADVEYRAQGHRARERLVVRLPPAGAGLFPAYDLAMQVAVQALVAEHGVPVPQPITLEGDPTWLGVPFLVMPLVAGHDVGELPVADRWLAAGSPADQRQLHERFLDVLAVVHGVPWRDDARAAPLRGADRPLSAEIDWWAELAAWTFDGDPPASVTDAFAWCRDRCPAELPPAGVLWGDVRLGNVLFDDDRRPVAVLDWEMASLGPAELDVSWYTALEAMTEHFFGQRVPGFLTRDEIIARHERALGRPLVSFRWVELFALCRSAVLQIRTDRLRAIERDTTPRPPERNAVLAYALDAIAAEPDR